jgi:hypothetical protein
MTRTAAYDRFVASMKIGYMEWHEGVPYDLDALAAVSPDELRELEKLLIERRNSDWRDAEALARISSPRTIEALTESVTGPNREVRLRAAMLLHNLGHAVDFEPLIVEALRFGGYGSGLMEAQRLAAAYSTTPVLNALLQGALCSEDGRGVSFASLLFFIHGKASAIFDRDQQPLFQRVGRGDPQQRRLAFDEMCRIIGIDGTKIDCGGYAREKE